MKDIQMVDLRLQYERLKPEIDEAVARVLESSSFIRGPEVGKFEEELSAYMGGCSVVSCANGTDALQLAMMALDLQPGDEVITTNFTFIATVEVMALLGLKPVLVDPDPSSFNLNPGAVEKAISPKTKAIVPVHLFGQCCDMEAILAIARKHDLFVIEDSAQASGTTYTFSNGTSARAGTMGTIGCTSFFPSKNLGCYGDGGALFTNDEHLEKKLRSLANHGMTVRYYHDHIGVNSRLDSIQAAVLRVKLRYLDQFNEARRRAAAFYDKSFASLKGVTIPSGLPWSDHIYHQYTLKINDDRRDELKKYLAEAGIPTMIYYPVPVSRQKAYQGLEPRPGSFPVTEQLAASVLSLPMHTELDQEQLTYITGKVRDFFN